MLLKSSGIEQLFILCMCVLVDLVKLTCSMRLPLCHMQQDYSQSVWKAHSLSRSCEHSSQVYAS